VLRLGLNIRMCCACHRFAHPSPSKCSDPSKFTANQYFHPLRARSFLSLFSRLQGVAGCPPRPACAVRRIVLQVTLHEPRAR
jgi:hypothetical protein